MGTREDSTRTTKTLEDLKPGRQLDGDSGAGLSPPDGFDMDKFTRGRKFYVENLFCCMTAHFFALTVGMLFPDFLQPLIYTKNSDTPARAKKRYVSTVKHVASWHYGNVWKEGSEAQKSVLAVRRMHNKVSKEMTNDGRENYFSQYHMGLVQSCFIGFPILYASWFGINCSESTLDDYVYFWYGIGHLLGIDPDHNVCAGGRKQAQLLCEQIQDQLYVKRLKAPSDDFYTLSDALLKGWNEFFRGTLSVPVILTYFQEFARQESCALGLVDTIRYVFWKVVFAALKQFSGFRNYMNAKMVKKFRFGQFED